MTDTDTDEEIPPPRPIVHGVASALSPLVRRIVANNPGRMTGPGTNTYLVGIDEIVVIDPGPDEAPISTPSPAAAATASDGSSAPTPTSTTSPAWPG